jgi:hypothetical protein
LRVVRGDRSSHSACRCSAATQGLLHPGSLEVAEQLGNVDAQAILDIVEGVGVPRRQEPEEASACLDRRADGLAAAERVTGRTTYLRARALVSLVAADLEAARQESAEAASADPMGINSPPALAIQARACLWLRDAEGARAGLTGMKAFPGRRVAAARLTAEAGLAVLEGRVDEAAEAYREAVEAWRVLECTLDLALCELDLVLLLGPDHLDATAAKEVRDIFTQLGVKPFLERLDRAVGSEQQER